MQLLIGAGLGSLFDSDAVLLSRNAGSTYWLIAFSSATHDIAADGFYMLALDSSQQSSL